MVWNKIDACSASPGVMQDEHGKIDRVRVSAKTGAGLDLLRETLAGIAQEKTQQQLENQAAVAA